METPITLVTSQAAFDQFFHGLDWENAYVKESHFAVARYLNGQTVENGADKILRILFVLPSEAASRTLEVIAYDVKNYWMSDFLDNEEPSAVIKRRQAEAQFGPFVSINASCLAYRWLNNKFSHNAQFYTRENFLNEKGRAGDPYDVDWRAETDLIAD